MPIVAQPYSGIDGFLGTRASIMLDVVVVAMMAVLPLMAIGIALARFRKAYRWHKQWQLTLAIVLLLAILAFEIDLRFLSDWESRAAVSPYYKSGVWTALVIHLCCAVPTFLVWFGVVVAALRHFDAPPEPGPHSRAHRRWGRVAAVGMTLTAVTGWVFYWLAFVA